MNKKAINEIANDTMMDIINQRLEKWSIKHSEESIILGASEVPYHNPSELARINSLQKQDVLVGSGYLPCHSPMQSPSQTTISVANALMMEQIIKLIGKILPPVNETLDNTTTSKIDPNDRAATLVTQDIPTLTIIRSKFT